MAASSSTTWTSGLLGICHIRFRCWKREAKDQRHSALPRSRPTGCRHADLDIDGATDRQGPTPIPCVLDVTKGSNSLGLISSGDARARCRTPPPRPCLLRPRLTEIVSSRRRVSCIRICMALRKEVHQDLLDLHTIDDHLISTAASKVSSTLTPPFASAHEGERALLPRPASTGARPAYRSRRAFTKSRRRRMICPARSACSAPLARASWTVARRTDHRSPPEAAASP